MQIALNSNYCLYRCQTHRLLQLQPFLLPCSTAFGFPTLSPLHCRAMASSPPSVQVRDSIDLTPKETQIFQKLLQVVRHFSLRTQLRVAGGWVRDKLLGKECYDIDIALDDMLGREFCEKINDYLSCTGEEKQGIGVIQCNPDQSKHLETARMRLFDEWIDFVNLRSEDYSENSRIPTMRFGTAKEDAYRRDLTINSLFYNINTSSVEDFTGRGIEDLKSGKIVTPLPPKDTFLDDPLRVLRAIRFGARFGFILDEELKLAAGCDDVRAAIADKISRERIGHEIDLMISGNEPVKAMTYICDLLLFSVVFSLPPIVKPAISEECDRLCIGYIDAGWNLIQLIGSSTFNDEQRRLYLYAALFLPFRKTLYEGGKARKIPVVNHIIRNSLKLRASDADTVVSIHCAVEKFISLIPFIESTESIQISEAEWGIEILDLPVTSKLRILTGLLLREIKGFWRVALMVSTLLYPNDINHTRDISKNNFQLDKRRKVFEMVENAIVGLGLEEVWELKPLVNGKDIMNVLQLKSGGPLVRDWQQKLIQWQLAHPSGTAEECLDWMRQKRPKRE
ncbi:tRNA nucleotidyltransferase cca2 [Vitis vinifera]|nr:tRNA nucleotidyltransferase cca2 [Vitis vinifera]|eukprot:XP_002266551.2 PREDICTED: putative CCA tRNA nucleotidyltransferase 2 [Vitis vinifera]